ncbi:hypothetical protein GW17_00045274 [Ensete ventricosum]|nr:hypothetical protein GW17_00045274 [Ensete ventricosum]
MVPQRRVFRVHASKLASDESLGHQHMGVVYHRGSMIGAAGEFDCFSAQIHLREPDKSEDKAKQDFRGVIDPLLLRRESIGRKRDRRGGECKSKLQVPRQGGRTEAKELHKTSVDGLLIKITESEGLGLMQECSTKEQSRQYVVLYLFYSEE